MLFQEPTSGLDSATSLQIMELISRLSKQGRTIVVSFREVLNETGDKSVVGDYSSTDEKDN